MGGKFCDLQIYITWTWYFFLYTDDVKTSSGWPSGQYAVVASMYGCPETNWKISYINLSLLTDEIYWTSTGISFAYYSGATPKTYNHSHGIHILGPYSKRSFQFTFCNRNDTNPSSSWPVGNYCLFGTDDECPEGTLHLSQYLNKLVHKNICNPMHKYNCIFLFTEDQVKTRLPGLWKTDFPLQFLF